MRFWCLIPWCLQTCYGPKSESPQKALVAAAQTCSQEQKLGRDEMSWSYWRMEVWLAFRCWNWPRGIGVWQRVTTKAWTFDTCNTNWHRGITTCALFYGNAWQIPPKVHSHTSQLPCSLPSTQGNQSCCFKPLQPMVGCILEVAQLALLTAAVACWSLGKTWWVRKSFLRSTGLGDFDVFAPCHSFIYHSVRSDR